MAGDAENSAEVAQLKGLGKYFNSITVQGRANVAKLTYAVCFGIGIAIWLRPRKPKPQPVPTYSSATPKYCECENK